MNTRPYIGSGVAFVAVFLIIAVVLPGCNGGARPHLVDPGTADPQPQLELDLSPAPAEAPPLAPAPADLPLESSVDDALVAWAADRSVAYLDSCSLVSTANGQLCDVPTERETTRLLGPSADNIWYVVEITEFDSLEFGSGFRVSGVALAGA